jgi:hypothetical protein
MEIIMMDNPSWIAIKNRRGTSVVEIKLTRADFSSIRMLPFFLLQLIKKNLMVAFRTKKHRARLNDYNLCSYLNTERSISFHK